MVPTKEAREEIEESGTHRTERARGLWRGRGVAAHGSAPYLWKREPSLQLEM